MPGGFYFWSLQLVLLCLALETFGLCLEVFSFFFGCVVFLIPYFFDWFKKAFEESSIADAHGVWWIVAIDPVTGDEKDLFL